MHSASKLHHSVLEVAASAESISPIEKSSVSFVGSGFGGRRRAANSWLSVLHAIPLVVQIVVGHLLSLVPTYVRLLVRSSALAAAAADFQRMLNKNQRAHNSSSKTHTHNLVWL